jgi:hypothetical protein
MTFAENLRIGRAAESLIANWLMARGNAIIPAYEIEKSHGKGPQFFTHGSRHAAPDVMAFTSRGIMWIEAKRKSVFTWHRITGRWTTGIDLSHYQDYIHVSRISQLPVWLLFLHLDDMPSSSDAALGCPQRSPVGLFGGSLDVLVKAENHRSPPLRGNSGHGTSGMVYWAHESLQLIATRDEVIGMHSLGCAA